MDCRAHAGGPRLHAQCAAARSEVDVGAANIGNANSSDFVSVAVPWCSRAASVTAAAVPDLVAWSERRDSASATTFVGPLTYSILKSKSASLSSQRDCRADMDCWVMKYCSELWSVSTRMVKGCRPCRYVRHS